MSLLLLPPPLLLLLLRAHHKLAQRCHQQPEVWRCRLKALRFGVF
jgi:hypothetical protein